MRKTITLRIPRDLMKTSDNRSRIYSCFFLFSPFGMTIVLVMETGSGVNLFV